MIRQSETGGFQRGGQHRGLYYYWQGEMTNEFSGLCHMVRKQLLALSITGAFPPLAVSPPDISCFIHTDELKH